MAREVTIVGAGIVGVCAAGYLQRAGCKVRLLDSGPPGMATSYGNAGGLSSGAFVPLSYPGILKQVPQWLRDPEGPLVVRKHYALKALPWLVRFVLAGRPAAYEQSARALKALTMPLFDNLTPLVRDAGAEGLIRRVGQLHLYSTDAAFGADARGREIRKAGGVRLEVLGGEEIRQMEPDLAPIFRHAVYFPEHGHCANPLGLTTALAETVVRNGGELVQARVHDLERGSEGVRALVTSAGRMPVEEVVIAAGVWSRELALRLGHKVPLESQRGYHAMVASPAATPRRNVQWTERKFIATPMEDGVRFAGTVEIAGIAAEPDYARADILLAHGRAMLPGLAGGEVTRWMGHRPCLPDSVPVIGRSPSARNVTFAFGHGHIGLITAPTTGRLVSEIVSARPPSIDPSPYRIDRF
jgi:D-amino-acid dehydrogenase